MATLIEKDIGALLMRVLVQATQPPPSTPAAGDIAGQVASAVERVGGTNNATQLLIIILLLIFAWRIVVPLIQANTTANQQIATMNSQTVASQGEVVRTLERVGVVLTQVENKPEAIAGRESLKKDINEHTDAAHKATDGKVDALDKKLDGVISTLEEAKKVAITQEKFDNTINPLVLKIDAALIEMRAMKTTATGEHPAVTVSAPAVNVNGDTPPVTETPSTP